MHSTECHSSYDSAHLWCSSAPQNVTLCPAYTTVLHYITFAFVFHFILTFMYSQYRKNANLMFDCNIGSKYFGSFFPFFSNILLRIRARRRAIGSVSRIAAASPTGRTIQSWLSGAKAENQSRVGFIPTTAEPIVYPRKIGSLAESRYT